MEADPRKPDEGLLQAYLDDELAREDRDLVEARLAEHAPWAQSMAELEAASTLLGQGLRREDGAPPSHQPPPWIEVLKRREARTAAPRVPLARAAVVTLLFAGAVASGLPGSPVREWLAGRSVAVTTPASTDGGSVATTAATAATAEVGVRVNASAGSVEVVLPQLPAEAELIVRLDGEGDVGVFGPNGTQFRTQEGRVDVLNPQGAVRIEVPADLAEFSVVVGDVMYLQRLGARLDVTGPATDRSDVEVRFGGRDPSTDMR